LAKNKIMYESKEAIDFVDVFFTAVNYYSLLESLNISKEKQFVFNGFEGSTYHDGSFFDQYVNDEFAPQTEKVKKLFDGIYLPTIEDWKTLKNEVMANGIAHSYRLAIAPTGSISYVQSSTASIAPITQKIEERDYGDSKTIYPMPFLDDSTFFFYKEAYDMDMFKMIDLYATAQKHIDQGISCTLYVKDNITTRELSMIYIYAWMKGLKTLYYTRTKATNIDECLSCTV
jgi:ribonucleoside-diphosphate reductase alpha chain